MSLKYEILKRVVKAANIKKQWTGMSTEELLENRRRANAKNQIPELKDDAFEISRIKVMGFPVVKMIHKKKADWANLFLIGGGMISAPRPGSIKKALQFAKETGLDLFVPYYPLCTDYPLTKAYEMIHETYRVMLEDYTAEHISVLGTSSGGNLALGMVPYINDGHGDTPMPGYIMAISPGTCVDTDEEWQRMQELDRKDVAIPAEYMKTAVEIMRHGDESVPDYMIWLQKGDFTNCPRVTFIYGSDETLYACAPSFEAAMQKYGVDYEMIVGDGMFHCYPVFPVCREGRDGWDMMIRTMREQTHGDGNERNGNMTRRDQIKNAYRLTGDHASFYDGMMTYSTLPGKAICRLVWNMDGEKNLRYLERALSGVPEGFKGKLLEVPVGTGVLSMPVYKDLPEADITCLDYSADMMHAAQAKAVAAGIRNITFLQGDVGSLPFEDATFDIVLSLNGFHAFPDKEAAYLETYRVLKKGGTFCGCFYVWGGCGRTDWMIKHLYQPKGYFTPPYETEQSLRERLERMYTKAKVTSVEGIACFRCRK